MNTFVKEVVARLKGDNAEVLASQNERKAKSGFKQQLSSLEAKQVDDEIRVAEALDAVQNAKYPTSKIENVSDYLTGISKAQAVLVDAQERLDATTESIKVWSALEAETFGQK